MNECKITAIDHLLVDLLTCWSPSFCIIIAKPSLLIYTMICQLLSTKWGTFSCEHNRSIIRARLYGIIIADSFIKPKCVLNLIKNCGIVTVAGSSYGHNIEHSGLDFFSTAQQYDKKKIEHSRRGLVTVICIIAPTPCNSYTYTFVTPLPRIKLLILSRGHNRLQLVLWSLPLIYSSCVIN